MFRWFLLACGIVSLLIGAATDVCVADAAEPLDAGLIARWQFTERNIDNRAFKPLAGQLSAELDGAANFMKAKPHALQLDGNSKAKRRLRVTDDLAAANLPAGVTVSAWVRVDKPQKWGGVVSALQDNGDYERGWILGFNESQFYFGVSSIGRPRLTYLAAKGLYQTGYWYHVVGTYDGKEQRVYVDGKLNNRSTEQRGNVAYPPKGSLTIGAYHDDNELYSMAGGLEQVSIWNRALSAAEVQSLFESRKGLFPEIEATRVRTTDWPTYLRDNQRSGMADVQLDLPLRLKWRFKARHAPRPAWPPPANQDFWHKKYRLQARVTYDRFFHLVSAGDSVYFASSADDQVYCLDARSGEVRWSFFAAAPVRLAPTIADDKVLFGADDGCVYCLASKDGSLLWKFRDEESSRWIPGNGRLISARPVRSSVLIEDGIGFFCAGLYPGQGIKQFAVDIRSGKMLGSVAVEVSAQGYLERRAGRLYAATGRDRAGAFVAHLKRRGKDPGKEVRAIPQQYPHAFIGAGKLRFAGGDGVVAALDARDGRELWKADVQGRAGSIAAARGRLLVSTDEGYVYCFTADAKQPRYVEQETDETTPGNSEPYAELAAEIIGRADVTRGYCLVLQDVDGQLARQLASRTSWKIVAVARDKKEAERARRMLSEQGLYGRAVVHLASAPDKLPFTDYLFNVVVRNKLAERQPETPLGEIRRVLHPYQGTALFVSKDEPLLRGTPPVDGGQWTHIYSDPANTACSNDGKVKGPLRLQWFGEPGPQQMIDRHHRTIAPLWSHGRLFVPGNDRVIGVDAYNGTVLWNVEVPDSRRVAAMRDAGSMAATQEALYVASADRCWALDSRSGKKIVEMKLPPTNDKAPRHWGYTACVDNLLFGSAVQPAAPRRKHSIEAIREGTYWDFRPIVGSSSLFSYDRHTGALQWNYTLPSGLIVNPTITIGDGRVYFVATADSTGVTSEGRVQLHRAFARSARLIALDMNSGHEVWQRDVDFTAIQHHLFAAYAKNILVTVGSRNDGADRKKSRVWYDICAFDARNGKKVWSRTQNNATVIGGDHGEQDHHPVIVGDRLYVEPLAYELASGKPIDWGWNIGHRRGCGTISASACAFFFRNKHSSMFDLASKSHAKVTQVTRPGCWINMIPAGGLLLIPEASSGCTCDFAVQASMAFIPQR